MRSHAASISRLIGWCALRSALNPASFSFSTRRSSARGIVAVPSTPLSWWMHAPRRSTASPLMRNPRAGSTSMVRIPNVVDARSSSPPSLCSTVRHVYSAGWSTLHRRGRATSSRCRSVSAVPGNIVSGASSRATTAPVSSTISVVTVVVVVIIESFSTTVATATIAPSSSTVGRGHVHAIEREVHRFADDEMDVPVDPGTRVPPGVVVRGRVDADRVLLAVAQVLADRHGEVRVSVRAVTDERAVHVHRRAAVDALELDHDALAAVGLGNDERLLVLPDAAREEAGAPVAPGVAPPTDHRVVGQAHRDPRGRRAAEQLREDVRLRAEPPVVVEGRTDHDAAPDSGWVR